jgi:hypothetical protein
VDFTYMIKSKAQQSTDDSLFILRGGCQQNPTAAAVYPTVDFTYRIKSTAEQSTDDSLFILHDGCQQNPTVDCGLSDRGLYIHDKVDSRTVD